MCNDLLNPNVTSDIRGRTPPLFFSISDNIMAVNLSQRVVKNYFSRFFFLHSSLSSFSVCISNDRKVKIAVFWTRIPCLHVVFIDYNDWNVFALVFRRQIAIKRLWIVLKPEHFFIIKLYIKHHLVKKTIFWKVES